MGSLDIDYSTGPSLLFKVVRKRFQVKTNKFQMKLQGIENEPCDLSVHIQKTSCYSVNIIHDEGHESNLHLHFY